MMKGRLYVTVWNVLPVVMLLFAFLSFIQNRKTT